MFNDGRRFGPAGVRRGVRVEGRAEAPAAAWLPSDITGVAEWWRADLGVTDAGGGAVSAWQGQIAGESLAQGTSSARPTLTTRDGQSVLSFDGGDYLQGAFGTLGLVAQPLTWIFVLEYTGAASTQWIIDGDNATNRILFGKFSTVYRLNAGTALSTTYAAAQKAFALVCNNTSSAIYEDNLTTPIVSGAAGTTGIDGVTFGGDYTGGSLVTGYLWEAILVDAAISAGDRALLGAYLDARYAGLSLTY